MRTLLQKCLSILLACCLTLQPATALGQQKTPAAASGKEAQPVATREINKDTVISKFQQLQQQSRAIQLLDSKLRSLEFLPAEGKEHYWGQTATYQKVVEGRTETLIGTIYIHDYVNPKSKDGVALGEVTLTSNSGATKTYPFYLVAPNGDVTKAEEYSVVNNEVTLQHSWWCCVLGQLPGAGNICTTAIAACALSAAHLGSDNPFSWVAFAACVGVACGVAFGKALLCCACNGDFWCKYLVGNCSQHVACPSPSGGGGAGGGGGGTPPTGTCNGRCCETEKGKCTKCVSLKQECP